jgi:regulation of enolase protein 1 (concanavalin A-like superfamily)
MNAPARLLNINLEKNLIQSLHKFLLNKYRDDFFLNFHVQTNYNSGFYNILGVILRIVHKHKHTRKAHIIKFNEIRFFYCSYYFLDF